MVDLTSALERAAFACLSAADLPAPVYTMVPEDVSPPLILLAEGSCEEIGGKSDRLEKHDLRIVCVTQGGSRGPLRLLMEAVRAALHDQPLPAQPGVVLSPPRLTTRDDHLEADGLTMVGDLHFLVFAQPAG